MNVCSKCGSSKGKLHLLPEYSYQQFGMSAILKYGVLEVTCDECDHVAHMIPNLEGLGSALAFARILSPVKLNGDELRFLRKMIGLQASVLADRLNTAPESYSRWENGHQPISDKNEKIFRVIVAAELEGKAPAIDMDIRKLMSMKIRPFRDECEEPITLQLVVFKEAKIKQKAWDVYEEADAA